ncbi:3557_t:CDS:2, partial [Acaulospora morrowiae]
MPVENPRLRLRRAAREGNLHVLKQLSCKIDIRNPDPENGWTTLMYAACHGHNRIVEYLIQHGHEDIELSRDFDNNTILMIAAQYNHIEIMKIYITHFPYSLTMVNKKGMTALIYACKFGHLDSINFLLECGSDINQTDADGNTTLHYAAAWERYKAVAMLIERGCQFAVKNNAGWTALDYSYSMELKAHLQECARAHHEEKKKNKKRNLKITVDSLISIDSVPLISSTRSATFPPGKPSNECENDEFLSSNTFPNNSLSP